MFIFELLFLLLIYLVYERSLYFKYIKIIEIFYQYILDMANYILRRALLDAVRVPAGTRSVSELAKVIKYIILHILLYELRYFYVNYCLDKI